MILGQVHSGVKASGNNFVYKTMFGWIPSKIISIKLQLSYLLLLVAIRLFVLHSASYLNHQPV